MRFTDVRHYDDEGFPRHSWRYEFDNGVTTLYPLSDAKILSIKPSDNPFKLIDSHGRYLLVNPGLWVQALKEREVRRNVFAFRRVS